MTSTYHDVMVSRSKVNNDVGVKNDSSTALSMLLGKQDL